MFVKIFQALADEGMGKLSKLLSWKLKSFSKFVLVWLAREKQNTLTS